MALDRSQQYLSSILNFVQRAGNIALKHLENPQADLKNDHSVVTIADLAVSAMAKEAFSEFLGSKGHLCIDEEDKGNARYLDQGLLEANEFIWSIDPIDGTRLYANRMPTYGISIGILKDLKPWVGVVFFPTIRELFYCDGQQAFFVQEAFTPNETKQLIKPIDQRINDHSIFLCTDTFFKHFKWDFKDCHVMIQACAVVNLCWPAIGRGCGALLRSSIWDFAGSWPVFQAAGLKLRSLDSGEVLDHLDVKYFNTHKPWELKEHYVLSSERNFQVIRDKITLA